MSETKARPAKRSRVHVDSSKKDLLSLLPREHLLSISSMLRQRELPALARTARAFRYSAVSATLSLNSLPGLLRCIQTLECGSIGTHKTLMQVRTLSVNDTTFSKSPALVARAISKCAAVRQLTTFTPECVRFLVDQRSLGRLQKLYVHGSTDADMAAVGRGHWSLQELTCRCDLNVLAQWPDQALEGLEQLTCGAGLGLDAAGRAGDIGRILAKTPKLRKLDLWEQCSDVIDDEWVDTVVRTASSRSLVSLLLRCRWQAPVARIADLAALWPRMEVFDISAAADGKSGRFWCPGGMNPMDLIPAFRIWSGTLRTFSMYSFHRAETATQFWRETLQLLPRIGGLNLWSRPTTSFSEPNDLFPADLRLPLALQWLAYHPDLHCISLKRILQSLDV